MPAQSYLATFPRFAIVRTGVFSVCARQLTTQVCALVVEQVIMTEAARRSIKGNGDEPWHGKGYGYQKKRCRCLRCCLWWSAYMKKYKAERIARTGEAFCSRLGGFVPGKPCACGCGETIPAEYEAIYKRGHKPR